MSNNNSFFCLNDIGGPEKDRFHDVDELVVVVVN